MTLFSYKATDGAGNVVRGTLEATAEKEAVARLQAMNYIPIRVEPGRSAAGRFNADLSVNINGLLQRITTADILMFTQDLHALLEAGLPVDKALSMMINVSEKDRFKDLISDILKNVQGGNSLSDALARHPRHFSRLYVNMVRAGEAGGVLPAVLNRLGQFLESAQDLKDYIKSALVYPLFLVFVGGISIVIMLTFVIPKFSVIFSDMGRTIPFSTQMLLSISHGLRAYWWLILAIIAGAVFMIRKYLRTTTGRLKADRFKLSVPIFGNVVRSVEVARFSRTLGTLIKSGVPILQALGLVRDIITNKVIAGTLQTVYERVKEGETLSRPLSQAEIFPPLAVQMIAVGEETGKLDQMLLRVADNYDRTVRNMIKRLVNLMEPAMILIMGLVVGFIVISMLLAVFSMNDIAI